MSWIIALLDVLIARNVADYALQTAVSMPYADMAFQGEYMTQYGRAEKTRGKHFIDNWKNKFLKSGFFIVRKTCRAFVTSGMI